MLRTSHLGIDILVVSVVLKQNCIKYPLITENKKDIGLKLLFFVQVWSFVIRINVKNDETINM